ncbi:MAG TPA: hypothetical protein VMN79_18735 [Casimicrobiaceae bacterium]|nr:hypothetical protein [Casimicrobiaceae bacterium]
MPTSARNVRAEQRIQVFRTRFSFHNRSRETMMMNRSLFLVAALGLAVVGCSDNKQAADAAKAAADKAAAAAKDAADKAATAAKDAGTAAMQAGASATDAAKAAGSAAVDATKATTSDAMKSSGDAMKSPGDSMKAAAPDTTKK